MVAGALTRSPSSPSAFPRRRLSSNLVNKDNPPPSALGASCLAEALKTFSSLGFLVSLQDEE